MTKQSKIIATEARFPLAALTLSPMNPRQNVPEGDVIELAKSIWAAGLIQNIAGLADKNGGAEIVAGGRRLRALHYLAEQHPDMATTRPELASPMAMLAPDAETAQTWAGLENVARRDLHPAEEIRAYGKMQAKGAIAPEIARAFAVSEKHVYRRLALANLPAPVLDALAKDEISLSMAACFTICDDEKHSRKVLKLARGEHWSDYNLKRALKPDSIKGSDRRAIFVGEDAYKAAGGRLGGDLFAEETLFDSPEILDGCFQVALEDAARIAAEKEGWKWIETSGDSFIGWYEIEQMKCARIYPVEGELSEEQSERYEQLEELVEDGAITDSEELELGALQSVLDGDYTEDQKAHAGAILHVDQKGETRLEAGLIKPEDKKTAIEAGLLQVSGHGSTEKQPKSAISAKLADDLGRIATGVRQHAALSDPDLLIDLLAYQLSHALHWQGPLGISTSEVPNWPTSQAEGYVLDERLTTPGKGSMHGKDLAKSFRAFRKKGSEHVRGELTRFLAAQYRGGDEKLQALVDKETSPNIREIWTPNAANFFKRVGGPYLVALWRDLLDLAEDHPTATTFAKLKKAEKAERMEKLFGDTDTRKALNITDAQAARIDAWLPEGME